MVIKISKVKEQMRLKLYNFDEKLMFNISNYNLPENISFDGIDKNNLYNFFDKISFDYSIIQFW